MTPFLLAALAIQAAPAATASVPIPAHDLGELDRCHPQRLGDASDCLRRALGEKTAAEIGTPAGDAYRDAVASLITAKWDLANPASPVARSLRGMRIYDPSDAAQVVFADMAARVGHYTLDYEKFARDRANRPAQPASAPVAKPEAVTPPGPLPLDRCKQANDAPDLRIVSCTLNPDRTISRTTAGASGAGIPPGATALSVDQCAAMGPLPAGSHLKACFRLKDGRLMRQTAHAAPPAGD